MDGRERASQLDTLPTIATGETWGTLRAKRTVPNGCVFQASFRPRTVVSTHVHSTARICFVIEGAVSESHTDSACVIPKGHVAFWPLQATHQDVFSSGRNSVLYIDISNTSSARLIEFFPRRPFVISMTKLEYPVESLLRGVDADDAPSALILEGAILEVVGRAARIERRQDIPLIVSLAENYIRENIGSPITPATVAAALRVNRRSLGRSFQEYLGVPIGTYIRRCRVRQAADAVVTTSTSLADIAHRFGYCDQAYMTREFVHLLGNSPRRYREMALTLKTAARG